MLVSALLKADVRAILAGRCAGRITTVLTGTEQRFSTVEELLAALTAAAREVDLEVDG